MDALPGTLATMRNAEVAQAPMTLISKGPVRKLRIFPKKFTANCVSKAFNSYTAKKQGDIGSLSALASLQRLDLANTKVEGDIGSLSALTSLKSVYFFGASSMAFASTRAWRR